MSDLVNAHYPTVSPEWLRAGSPAGAYGESCRRLDAVADLAVAASGVELSAGIPLAAGITITAVTFVTGATAAVTPTAGYIVVRDAAGNKLGQSADFTNTARAANTAYTVPLAVPVTVPASGLYRIGVSLTAGTVFTLRGANLGAAAMAAVGSVLAVTHGAAVGGVAPATTVAPATGSVVPYFLVS